MEQSRNGGPCMDRFELSHKTFDLQSTPLFEPCPRCRTRQKWGTSPYCRECTSEYNKKYYAEHREQKLKWQRENRSRIRENQRRTKQEFVMQKGGRCEKCGYDNNGAVLGFHHFNGRKVKGKRTELASENPHSKQFNISEVILVCSNCHGEIHHPEFQVLKVLST
jgi:hypothetical protein